MLNIRQEVVAILQAISAGNGEHDTDGWVHILSGRISDQVYYTSSMGTLSHVYPERILNMINYLIQIGYISCEQSMKLQLEDSGRKFLQFPSNLSVSSQALRLSPYDNMLHKRLLARRQDTCETESLPPFRVLTSYAIQRVVQDRPENLDQLANIPGLGPFKVKKYGNQLLDILHTNNQTQFSLS